MNRRKFLKFASLMVGTVALTGCATDDGADLHNRPAATAAPLALGVVAITQQPAQQIRINAGSSVPVATLSASSRALTATLVWAATSQPAAIPGVSVEIRGNQIFLVTTSSAQIGSFGGLAIAVQGN